MKPKIFYFETDAFGFVVKREIDRRTGKRIDRFIGAKLAFILALCFGLANAGVYVENASSIEYAGDYAIITFVQNGSITVVNQTLYNINFLVVGGGGAGGYSASGVSGGGGGGQVTEVSAYNLTNAIYAIKVGGGGLGANPSSSGQSSSFASFTAVGGSHGQDGSGGSGGNSGNNFLGGAGVVATKSSGGGAGASQNGTNSSINGTVQQPNGGNGVYSSVSGANQSYGGGGGGGAYGVNRTAGNAGIGGGGLGGVSNSAVGGSGTANGTDGTANTGGGGGGSSDTTNGGSGGSGIVIVKMNISYYPLVNNPTGYIDYCNGTNDSATAITWIGYDITTGLQANYTILVPFQQVYNSTLLTENFTGAVNDTSNFSLCVFPANASVYAQASDIMTSVGYFPSIVSRDVFTYTNSTKTYVNYLLPYGNYSKLVQIFVVDSTYTAFPNVFVKIEQVNPATSMTALLGSFITDSFGITIQPLQPAVQIYHFSVLDANGTILQDFPNSAVPCQSIDLVCKIVLVVRGSNTVPVTPSINGTSAPVSGTTTFGRDGWLAVILVFVVAATLLTSNLAVSMVIGCFGLFVALAFGLIPLTETPIVILFAVAAMVLAFRLKV